MSAETTEEDAIKAVAVGQRVLHRAAIEILQRDKCDGLRAAKWLDAHSELLNRMIDEAQSYLGMSDHKADQIRKFATWGKANSRRKKTPNDTITPREKLEQEIA